MIVETALILGSGAALIAVQPLVWRLFPPKPKPTMWEKFWAEAPARWAHVEKCGYACESKSSDIFDHKLEPECVCASCGKPVSVCKGHKTDLSSYTEALKKTYVPQMQKQLDTASGLMSQIQTQMEANRAFEAEQQREALRELDRVKTQALIAEKKAEIERLRYANKPKMVVPESKRAAVEQAWQPWSKASIANSPKSRAEMTWEAEERGMRLYLDHATNQYALAETQLSRNLDALKAATKEWEFEKCNRTGARRWRFGTQIESRPWLTAEQLDGAKTYEDLYKLVAPGWSLPSVAAAPFSALTTNPQTVRITDATSLDVSSVLTNLAAAESGGAWVDELEGKVLKLIKADGR